MALKGSITGAGNVIDASQEVVIFEERFEKDGKRKLRIIKERVARSIIEWRGVTLAACNAYANANKSINIQYLQDSPGSASYTLRRENVNVETISRITTDDPDDEDNSGDYS